MKDVHDIKKLEVKIMGIKNSSVLIFIDCSYILTNSHLIINRRITTDNITTQVDECKPINLDTIVSFRVTK